ncbi:hypothetical protein INR49_006909 [Caranx melampygus]|nr:hypothetical protein INR49_006909 [Caranx melampygus]
MNYWTLRRCVSLSQISAAMEMMERLKRELHGKEKELNERQQEMVDIERFLRETAEKEAEAKTRLQLFIETLLDRADRAERQLLQLSSHTHHDSFVHRHHSNGDDDDDDDDDENNRYTHADVYAADPYARTHVYAPVLGRGGRSLDGSTDDMMSKMQGTIGNRRSDGAYEDFVSGLRGWDCESGLVHLHPSNYPPPWTRLDRGGGGGGGDGRRERLWAGEGGWGRTWNKRHRRHHSTEEEEEEEEEEEGDEEEGRWSSIEMRRLVFSRTHTPGSDVPSSVRSTPSRRHGDRHLGAESLRLRAGLFCVFPYLDVRALLHAAEVCSDWRFVARHPAVWTRLRLENARVSTEWCTQTQSVVLNNLKPRSRRADETREDYHRNTRGSVEPGVEALLRSAGGSLLHLTVSQCPHILTDRTLCQQPTRFGNRCLQTIGRCWPHLRSLSVGGAGCGTQGLAAVVRTCAHLQVLELERITDLGLQVATELCRVGLKDLRTLILTHTPVSGQAILHFHSETPQTKAFTSIVVEVSVSDYFEEPDTQEAQHLFGEILCTLKVLQSRPGLSDVLQVKAEGFC